MTLSQARIAGSSGLSPRKPLTIANQPLHLTSDHDSTMCRESRDPELRDFSLLCCPRMSSLVCQAHGTSPKNNQNGIKLCFPPHGRGEVLSQPSNNTQHWSWDGSVCCGSLRTCVQSPSTYRKSWQRCRDAPWVKVLANQSRQPE